MKEVTDLLKELLKDKYTDFHIDGLTFNYCGKRYDVENYEADSLSQFASIILPLMSADEVFAFYDVHDHSIRGAILPNFRNWTAKVVADPDNKEDLILEFTDDMMRQLGWHEGDELEYFIERGKIRLSKK